LKTASFGIFNQKDTSQDNVCPKMD